MLNEACPVNNLENAKKLVSFAESDPAPLLAKCRINDVLGQYHSAFEHTFVWIVDAEDAHLIEEGAWNHVAAVRENSTELRKGSGGEVSLTARLECSDRPLNGLQDADRRLKSASNVRRARQSLHRNPGFGYPSCARTAKMDILDDGA